jgi:short-subunit dehydrogenase
MLEGKRVVVTGAASGIGRASAEAFAREGAELALCDRDEAKLAETARALGSAVTLARTVDVSKRDEMRRFASDAGTPDVLVNNAGVGLAGGILDTTLEDWEWILSINLWGVVHGCHFFVPGMVEKRRGHVVNVASALGLFGAPEMLGYCTTKFAVVGLSESMRAELAPHGVHVSTICPGVVDTNIVHTTRYKRDADAMRTRVASIYKRRAYGPEKVAAAIVSAVKRRKGVVPVTPEAWLAYYMKRFAPSLAMPIARAMQKRAAGG